MAASMGATEVAEPQDETGSSPDVEKIEAFARLYGYVRFFHPSDEAASIDWDRFALLGAIRIREAGPSGDLLDVMNRLFSPIAPTVAIYPTGSEPDSLAPPVPSAGLTPVTWQHVGVRLPGSPSIYLSKRTNREARFVAGGDFGTVVQAASAAPFRGKDVKLTASIRAEVVGEGNQGQMWLREDRSGGERGFFDNMRDRPITSDEWREYEITATIAEDADQLVFGCFLLGRGRVWFDHVRLAVADDDGGWTPVELDNPGFEEGTSGVKPVGWSAGSPGFEFKVTGDHSAEGERSLLITHQPDQILTEDLFEARPAAGDVIDVELGAGLSARIPLVAWSDESSTRPPGDEKTLNWMRIELDSINLRALSEYSECTRVAGIVILWNVLQHFYPSFDVLDVDWDAELTRALERTVGEEEAGERYYSVLEGLAVALDDGRARAYHYRYAPYGYLPVLVDWVEDQVVITASAIDELKPGDVVSALDGVDALKNLQSWEARKSGSTQRKRTWALGLFGSGQPEESLTMTLKRGEETTDLKITLGQWNQRPPERRPEALSVLEGGVFYVDLTRATTADVERRISEIASARGVVFDLRGSLSVDRAIIGHLLTEPDTTPSWMQAPEIIRPDGEGPVGWRDVGWWIQPDEPRIEGNVAILTDGRTIGDAESVVDLIRVRDLAEIVGQPTAGAAGEVNNMTLPGRFEFRWTGVRVPGRSRDEGRLSAIRPSVPASLTIQGLREGRDDILDLAVRLVSTEEIGD